MSFSLSPLCSLWLKVLIVPKINSILLDNHIIFRYYRFMDAKRFSYTVTIYIFILQSVMSSVMMSQRKTSGPHLPDAFCSSIFIIDGHTHDLVSRNGSRPVQAGMTRLKKAGITGVVLSFPLNRTDPDNVIRQIIRDKEFVKQSAFENNVSLTFINRFSFAPDRTGDHPLQVLLSVEYFDGLFDENLTRISQLKEIGISSITLDDNKKNRLSELKNGKLRLTEFGMKIIKRLNDLDIFVDISHLSEPLQLEVIKTSRKPVFASHSNMQGVADIKKNLSDKVMRELTKIGGIVLLTFDKEYLYGQESNRDINGISRLIEHIDYIAEHYSIDYIGIGSDYGGSGKNAPPDLFNVECFQLIAMQLIRKGYSSEHVEKIMGGNLVKFFSSEDKKDAKEGDRQVRR